MSPSHRPNEKEKNTSSSPSTSSTASSILPLYKLSPTQPTLHTRLRTSLSTPIRKTHSGYILLICCFITGLLDSTLFYAYGTFVSGQTGNTILFGLGASTSHTTNHPYRWAKSLLAISCFLCGCVCFSHAVRTLGKLKRGTLMLSFALQGAIVLLVGGFVQAEVVEGRLHKMTLEIDWEQCLPIAFLSFQSAGQVVLSRTLGVMEIPTVVLTSMLHDLVTDPRLLKRNHERRDQMVGAFVVTLLGAVVGGFLSVNTGKMQGTLWLVGGLKFVIAGVWMVWPGDNGEGEGEG